MMAGKVLAFFTSKMEMRQDRAHLGQDSVREASAGKVSY